MELTNQAKRKVVPINFSEFSRDYTTIGEMLEFEVRVHDGNIDGVRLLWTPQQRAFGHTISPALF